MDKVQHFEIPYDEKERAVKFYQEVFGWGVQDMPEMDYTIVRTVEVDDKFMPKESGAINGGMYKRQKGECPVVVITVKSIDETIKKVESSGGSVDMPKQQVGDMGFYAKVKDSEGNVVGIWENIKKE